MKRIIFFIIFGLNNFNIFAASFELPDMPQWLKLSIHYEEILPVLQKYEYDLSLSTEDGDKIIFIKTLKYYNPHIINVKLVFTDNLLSKYTIFYDLSEQMSFLEHLLNTANCKYDEDLDQPEDLIFAGNYGQSLYDELESNSSRSTQEKLDRLNVISAILKFNIFSFDDCQVAMKYLDPERYNSGVMIVMQNLNLCE